MIRYFYLAGLACLLQLISINTGFFFRGPGNFITDTIKDTTLKSVVDIGSKRQLFIDNFLIDKSNAIETHLNLPTPKGIVMIYNKPWEGSGSDFQVVFRDGNIIRMYYTAAQLTNTAGTKLGGHPAYACYAESKDGIHWVKPNLGLFEFNGSRKNNIVWSMPHFDNFTPFKDPNPDCKQDEKYKAVGLGVGGLFAFKSADGIHWSYLSKKPIITKGAFDSQNNAFWDSIDGKYFCYIRGFHDGIRDIRVSTSKDFHNWSDPQLIRFINRHSAEKALYTNQIRPYYRAPYLFLGFPTQYVDRKFSKAAMQSLPDPVHRMRRMKFSPRYGTTITNGLFMSSRDGITFKLWDDPFIPPGPERNNNWVYGDGYQSLGLLETPADDPSSAPVLSFYAGEGHWKDSPILRRYTIRIDGFVSLHGGQSGGELVTRPLVFTGQSLSLNFSTSAAGSILIELEDVNGNPFPGFSFSDCDELFGDTIDRTVTWQNNSDVSSLEGKQVLVRMKLREADLFSFKFIK